MQSVAISIGKSGGSKTVGAAVFTRLKRTGMDDPTTAAITLYQFVDNEQFSGLDSFLVQIGGCVLYLSDEFEDLSKGDGRKVGNLLQGKDVEAVYRKKALFTAPKDIGEALLKLVGKATHATNTADTEMPLAHSCINCLLSSLRLLSDDDHAETFMGSCDLRFGSLSTVMKLDSAAAEAVNLLPKADHPSQYGSLYGVLNRCKTKIGARLLERWLRQPLIDQAEIERRLNIVEILKNNTLFRNQLIDGPLKGVPDVDSIISKMQRKTAALEDVFRLYVFTRSLPSLVAVLTDLLETAALKDDSASSHDEEIKATIFDRFITPLNALVSKFALYQELVEHVVDFNQLPDLMINSQHDPALDELRQERDELLVQAQSILSEASRRWASFADIKLERNSQHGFILRTTRADDERQLRKNNAEVIILSLQKNGVHASTPKLKMLGDRVLEIDREYHEMQKGLVEKSVATALSYLPVLEAASAIVAEIDVLTSFAITAAVSCSEYVRPKIHPKGSGIINLKKARHPCVELMDGVDFISNDYLLARGKSSFQILTGPNMGGKSTYIRGIGSIAVMAQIGSFVPCAEAELSIVDCILARVGAGDAVSRGVSTFMAEMLEASVILQTATKDSLIIIDELGRGTSTFDGFGLAWAISEFMVTKIDCLCLFATHFHELTALANKHSSVCNKHVSAMTDKKQVVMLYNVADGPCTQSFGVHVAATASFPQEVINEAKRKAAELEELDADNENRIANAQARVEKTARAEDAMKKFASMTDVKSMDGDKLRVELKMIFPPFPISE